MLNVDLRPAILLRMGIAGEYLWISLCYNKHLQTFKVEHIS
jgi:hypothetical protein